ncbi:MAG: hypothetical protein OWQ49_00210 [Aquificaceae bacterium]|nr:hypothetical protein [Aquificaceae bacterium]
MEVYFLQRVKEGDKEAFDDLLYFCGFIPDGVKRYELLKELSKATSLPITSLQERIVKVEKREEKEQTPLSYHEAVLLAGLYRFGFEGVELDKLRLSPYLMELIEALKREEYHLIPDYVKNFKAYNLERAFQESLRALSLPDIEKPTDFEELRQKSKAQPRKLRIK